MLVDELINGAVRAVPDLGGALEAELGKAVEEMATFAAQQTAADLDAVLRETTGATPEARVDAAVEVLLGNFEYEMTEGGASADKAKKKKGKRGEARSNEPPTVIASLRSSLTALDRIDDRLKSLAERKDLSQQQNMEKQLIQS